MNDKRLDALQRWCEARIPEKIVALDPISSDAGFRYYFRVHTGEGTRVAMDAPPDKLDVRPFMDVHRRLDATGVHVPEILAADAEQGFVLLSDLGDMSYLNALNADSASCLFDDAIQTLLKIQSSADAGGLPVYDAALLRKELDLFPDWFLARHWHIEPTETEQSGWESVCQILIERALAQPRVFVHRDYMPRNLMVTEPNPGIIDFQDAVAGPISYDPVCLFRDAFLSWPADQVDIWLETYRRRAAALSLPVPDDPEHWLIDCDLMGAQRHLKVIGIFARIRYRDAKPRYLEDSPRFFDYLEKAVARNRELGELGTLLKAWRSRRRTTT